MPHSIFTSKLNYYRGSNAPWRSTPVGEPQVNLNPGLDCFVASFLA